MTSVAEVRERRTTSCGAPARRDDRSCRGSGAVSSTLVRRRVDGHSRLMAGLRILAFIALPTPLSWALGTSRANDARLPNLLQVASSLQQR